MSPHTPRLQLYDVILSLVIFRLHRLFGAVIMSWVRVRARFRVKIRLRLRLGVK